MGVLAGFGAAFGLGVAIGGTVAAGLTGLLWGGAVRMFFLHHVTYSINSICHFFGRRGFATPDQLAQRVVAGAAVDGRVLAQQPPRLPDLRRPRAALVRQIDISALVISALEKVGLVWDVVRVSPERQARKAASAA